MNIEDLFEKHSVAYYDANEAKTEVLTKRRFTAAVAEIEQQLFVEERQNEMLIKECEDLKKEVEIATKALFEIQEYQMQKVQLARTTDVYKIAGKALTTLGKNEA